MRRSLRQKGAGGGGWIVRVGGASLGLCVTAEGQLLPVSCFSPAGVMSDKRQRARVQGSWARQAPKPSGPAGRYS